MHIYLNIGAVTFKYRMKELIKKDFFPSCFYRGIPVNRNFANADFLEVPISFSHFFIRIWTAWRVDTMEMQYR